jgi:photosynthetic reaction center cytochrome c subunit
MRRLPWVGALVLCASALVSAQGGQPPMGAASAPQERPPRPPENLKVLPPDTNLRVEMPKIAQALGVECGFCHVQGNFPSDEYTTKRTARRMMEMVKTMNATFFPKHERKEGDSPLGGPVSCFTCHRGEKKPAAPPALSKPSPPLR